MPEDKYSIFIGYRRDDTADAAGRVYDRLHAAFGSDAVFKDVDTLPVGVNFGDHIRSILPGCKVFLAMIGPHWLSAADGAGLRRLDSPEDWVRIELELALETADLQVVPVLTNGATMPRPDQLPASLRALSALNGAVVRRDPDFHHDMDRLIKGLRIGASTGTVRVDAPAGGDSGAPAQNWTQIEASLDVRDYDDFIALFANAPEVFEARRHKRQIEDWAAIDHDAPAPIVEFRRRSLFPALGAETKQVLAGAEETVRLAEERETARTEARARIEAEKNRKLAEESKTRLDEITTAEIAAATGNPEAEYALALLYDKSWLHKDKALTWLRKAAEKGHAEAQFQLAKKLSMKYFEQTRRVDYEPQSGEWYRKAARNGHAEAKRKINELDRWRRSAQHEKEIAAGMPHRWRLIPFYMLADIFFAAVLFAVMAPILFWFFPSTRDAILDDALVNGIRSMLRAMPFKVGIFELTALEIQCAACFATAFYFGVSTAIYNEADGVELARDLPMAGLAPAAASLAFFLALAVALFLPNVVSPWLLIGATVFLLYMLVESLVTGGRRTKSDMSEDEKKRLQKERNADLKSLAGRTAMFLGAFLIVFAFAGL